jgi:hypothetical protein
MFPPATIFEVTTKWRSNQYQLRPLRFGKSDEILVVPNVWDGVLRKLRAES